MSMKLGCPAGALALASAFDFAVLVDLVGLAVFMVDLVEGMLIDDGVAGREVARR